MGMNVSVAQPSFAAGELSPSLRARTDLAKYRVGLALCRNAFVLPTGGAASRTGLGGVLRSKTLVSSGNKPRLIPFTYSTTQTYMLEFGSLYMRVIMNGGYVLEAAQSITTITPGPVFTLVNKVGHGYSAGDWLFISSVVGPVNEFSSKAPGKLVVISGSGFSANSFEILTIDGARINSSAWPGFVSGNMARVLTVTSPFNAAQVAAMKYTQNADTLTLTVAGVQPRNLTRSSHTSWTFSTVTFAATVQPPTALVGTPLNPGGVGGQNFDYAYVVTAVYDLTGEESIPSSVCTITNKNISSDVRLQNQISWTAPATGPTPDRYNIYATRGYLTVSAGTATTYGYIGQAAGALNFVDTNVEPDFSRGPPKHYDPFADYGYPACSTYFGGRKWYAGTNLSPELLMASQSGKYNNADYHIPVRADDGLIISLLSNQVNPIKHMLSLNALLALCASGAWLISSDQNDAGLTALSIRARPQIYDGVSDVVPINVSSDVLYCSAAQTSIKTLAYDFTTNLFTGADITLLASHFFIGYTLQALAYAEAPFSVAYAVRSDGAMPVMTYIKAQDVYGWALWTTPGNSLADDFIDCAVIREGTEDVMYCVVSRTSPGVNAGAPYFVIERLSSRAWYDGQGNVNSNAVSCLDSFIEVGAGTVFYGFDHLIGSTVYVYADGAMRAPVVVAADGSVTLDRAVVTRALIGLPYTPELQTLRFDFGDQQSAIGKRKKVTRVSLVLTESRGITIAPMKDDINGNSVVGTFYPLRERNSQQTYSSALPYIEGVRSMTLDPGWQKDGSLNVRGTPGVPFTVLALIPTISVGDDTQG